MEAAAGNKTPPPRKPGWGGQGRGVGRTSGTLHLWRLPFSFSFSFSFRLPQAWPSSLSSLVLASSLQPGPRSLLPLLQPRVTTRWAMIQDERMTGPGNAIPPSRRSASAPARLRLPPQRMVALEACGVASAAVCISRRGTGSLSSVRPAAGSCRCLATVSEVRHFVFSLAGRRVSLSRHFSQKRPQPATFSSRCFKVDVALKFWFVYKSFF